MKIHLPPSPSNPLGSRPLPIGGEGRGEGVFSPVTSIVSRSFLRPRRVLVPSPLSVTKLLSAPQWTGSPSDNMKDFRDISVRLGYGSMPPQVRNSVLGWQLIFGLFESAAQDGLPPSRKQCALLDAPNFIPPFLNRRCSIPPGRYSTVGCDPHCLRGWSSTTASLACR